ncbi:hypothetical protein BDD26_0809 [Xenorhabdus cabanillasii]|uniref:Uncharacterized protein n=1 Tax=Xenorhabdus cabanillasii TaxID=351673 RepID=A0A3D9UJP2_9GAMM|nr:hypothetical protein Xcab_02958 [Xenorhabdus cabanillasii JM26]REF26204.1 hypothetical protein BDD26_0809 [Xenorhabdus cabanillasii]
MTYIIISLLMLIPFFFIVKRFLLSSYVHYNVFGIILTILAISFHMYVFRFGHPPLVHSELPHHSIIFYGSIAAALLHCLIYSICFKLYYDDKDFYDDH